MMRPSFIEGVILALAATLFGGLLHSALTTLLPQDLAVRLLVAAASLGYILYLLYRSAEPLGRPTTLAAWLLAAGLAGLLDSLPLYLLIHVGLIWLIRSLYFYSSLLAALLDLILCGLGLVAAGWAARQSGSAPAVIWCFFLTQALFAAIPPMPGGTGEGKNRGLDAGARFARGLNEAETALHKLTTND